MKRQYGFISSSSHTTYQTWYTWNYYKTYWKSYNHYYKSSNYNSSKYNIMKQLYDTQDISSTTTWSTYQSDAYQRIEYFIQADEKLADPVTRDSQMFQPLLNYSKNVAAQDLYDGFVDIVITLPTTLRIAGIQLLNPWVNDTVTGNRKGSYWRYLPTQFNIYRVQTDRVNESLQNVSYQTDVANTVDYNGNRTIRPVRYDRIQSDSNMTLLGTYSDINWALKTSQKCFFKYNPSDQASVTAKDTGTQPGTATWNCKQLVIRIFKTGMSVSSRNKSMQIGGDTQIQQKIYQYMLKMQKSYGTKYLNSEPTVQNIRQLLNNRVPICSKNSQYFTNWSFGSSKQRNYRYASDVKFKSGIQYKLGGIQLLFSPDVFAIGQMKMYNYNGTQNNRVYIGQWSSKGGNVFSYPSKNTRISPRIDIDQVNYTVQWDHRFNIPPEFLQAKMQIVFTNQYADFKAGQVITNLSDASGNPLSIKLSNDRVCANLVNGIGFTDPSTGQFVSFYHGVGVNHDVQGQDAVRDIALKAGANVVKGGSRYAYEITGGFPFKVYFVVKRLF